MATQNLTYNGNEVVVPMTASTLKIDVQPDPATGRRQTLGTGETLSKNQVNMPKFKYAPTGVITEWDSSESGTFGGVCTTNQSFCVAIIAATLDATGAPTQITFLHFSGMGRVTDRLKELLDMDRVKNATWLALAGGPQGGAAVLDKVKENINAYPGVKVKNTFLYRADMAPDEKFGFGIDRTGRIGQVEGGLSW